MCCNRHWKVRRWGSKGKDCLQHLLSFLSPQCSLVLAYPLNWFLSTKSVHTAYVCTPTACCLKLVGWCTTTKFSTPRYRCLHTFTHQMPVCLFVGICQLFNTNYFFDTKKPTTSQKPTATPWWRSTLTSPDCCQSSSSTRDVRTSRPEATQLWRLWWQEKDVHHTSTLLILIFIGTVSATYGTLIVLAISFAIAAIGKTTLLEVILVSHVPSFCQVPCSTTACSQWGNKDIVPPSTIPGTLSWVW